MVRRPRKRFCHLRGILAGTLKLPIELLEVVDIGAATAHIAADKARYLDTIIAEGESASREHLDEIAATFAGLPVSCKVERGRPADVIIERAEAEKGTLIAMATHGRSGINRWMMGSVAEKVLRGTTTPLFLVRASDGCRRRRRPPSSPSSCPSMDLRWQSRCCPRCVKSLNSSISRSFSVAPMNLRQRRTTAAKTICPTTTRCCAT